MQFIDLKYFGDTWDVFEKWLVNLYVSNDLCTY